MRKSLAECKDWVVVLFSDRGETVLESYTNRQHAAIRRNAILRRGINCGVYSKAFAVQQENEGAWAWNRTIRN